LIAFEKTQGLIGEIARFG
jgi:hypothetical protein